MFGRKNKLNKAQALDKFENHANHFISKITKEDELQEAVCEGRILSYLACMKEQGIITEDEVTDIWWDTIQKLPRHKRINAEQQLEEMRRLKQKLS